MRKKKKREEDYLYMSKGRKWEKTLESELGHGTGESRGWFG